MLSKSVIGQTEAINLPEISEELILARVDTGARTSALWVSHVKETDAGLAVVFFGKGSPLFTGAESVFTEYGETVVISSSGHTERRYKIKLAIRLDGRIIRAWFTLADRSKQVYPVLIGRNILRGKFMVDVSQGNRSLKSAEAKRTQQLRKQIEEKK